MRANPCAVMAVAACLAVFATGELESASLVLLGTSFDNGDPPRACYLETPALLDLSEM
jgi:hypothetical protein